MRSIRHEKPFYGWYIVLAGAVIMGADIGIISNCASQFIKPVSQDLGVTRAAVSMNQTIMSFCYMLTAFMAGRIFTRNDLGRILKIDLFVVSAAYFCYSFASSTLQLYIISVIVGFGNALLGALCFSVIIPNWFIENRGRAIGLSFMGSGVGGMIFNYLAGQWLQLYGWRMTYRILAVCLFVLMAPFILFVLKVKPSEKGLEPYGSHHDARALDDAREHEGKTFKEAVSSPSFWIICLGGAILSACTNTSIQTISPHLSDVGYSASFAALMVSAAMGSLAIGKMVLGQLYDRVGPKLATLISGLSSTLGLAGLLFCRIKPALALIIWGAGLGAAFGSVAVPIITQSVFGRKEYTAIYGFISGMTTMVTVVIPTVNNMVYDRFGSYDPAYIVTMALSVVAAYIFTSFFSSLEKK